MVRAPAAGYNAAVTIHPSTHSTQIRMCISITVSPGRNVFVYLRHSGFISSCLVQPIMLNEETEDADIAALHGSDARALRFKQTLYASGKVQRIVRKLLPIFDRRGLLD